MGLDWKSTNHDIVSSNSIPTYTATKSQIQSLYDGVKERNDTWASAFSTGEGYFQTLLNVASYATQVGLSVAKPVVGEDPGTDAYLFEYLCISNPFLI